MARRARICPLPGCRPASRRRHPSAGRGAWDSRNRLIRHCNVHEGTHLSCGQGLPELEGASSADRAATGRRIEDSATLILAPEVSCWV
jgi:hypothetical protein